METSPEQCAFLQRIVHEIGARRCLEIGLANGFSALAIAEACGGQITTIDPNQFGLVQNTGLRKLESAGHTVRHFEERSQAVLPRLAGERFDFAYVDTTKIFDAVLVDAYYITRLLRVGGVVAFDDCNWPGVRKVVRYLAHWPHMSVYATFGKEPSSRMRMLGNRVARVIPLAGKILRSELIETDEDLGIAAQCVAFQKTAEDPRLWDWPVVP